jgi:two-component system, NtrC family, sensor kinase
VVVPLLRHNEVVGTLGVSRRDSVGFTVDDVAILQTFANQPVIAIENTRLFNELQESLQQPTATADVLKVIGRSTFDILTVLDTLVESAARLLPSGQGKYCARQQQCLRCCRVLWLRR